MARIPDTEIEQLKNEVSVQRLVESAGIALKKSGKDMLGKCPFHEDDTASLVVTIDKNLWHCFGCGLGGGPIDWVIKKNGVSFRHAVELLREDISSLAARPGVIKRGTVRALPPPIERDGDDTQLLNQVATYYHDTLQRSPEVLAYLQERGIDSPDAITHFKLGFANRTLGLRLPNKQRKEGLSMRTRLERLGIMRETSGHEHLAGSLVIPIMDGQGNVQNLYGRKIGERLRSGTPKHLYLPGPHRGVFNVAALVSSKEIILCEALIDALTFWCAGYRNVTAAYGAEGFTDELFAAFKHYGIERVLIAYDRDEAGERSAEKIAARLIAEGIECFRIQFPKGMDANQYALKVTPAQRSLGLAIRKALWLGKGPAPHVSTPAAPIANIVAAAAPETMAPPAEKAQPALAAETVLPATAEPATPAPPPSVEVAAQVRDDAVHFTFGERRYRVRGLPKNLGVEVLKINLLAARGEDFFIDTFDLYSARQRSSFVTQAALELHLTDDIVRADLGKILQKLEALHEEQLHRAVHTEEASGVTLSAEEQADALALLRAPDLLNRIVADFDACGLVGERTNKLVGYLAAVSRKLGGPLAIVVQSSSAAGKSSLMDAVLAFMPEEERVKYSAMTGQSLFYMGETNLKHKILAICEEEGASRASYALKLLQSDGELTMASTGKDPQTGNLITQQYRVEGPVMIFLTTTAIDIDDELLNRCIVLSVDEGRAQTEAIHKLQRVKRTLAGLLAKEEKDHVIARHRNAQRLLRSLAVVNPYADQLTFLSDKTRTRRDHEKYLTLIDTIALLHQYQRDIKSTQHQGRPIEYIEVVSGDIEAANALAHEVLGRSLDELPAQTRRLLNELLALVQAKSEQAVTRSDVRFSRREVRAQVGWGDTQVRVHLERLTQLEYVIVHRGARGQTFEYELLYDGDGGGDPHLSGLLDMATMRTSRDGTPPFAGPSRGQNGADAGPSHMPNIAAEQDAVRLATDAPQTDGEMHFPTPSGIPSSYVHSPLAATR
jgi:DNA primase